MVYSALENWDISLYSSNKMLIQASISKSGSSAVWLKKMMWSQEAQIECINSWLMRHFIIVHMKHTHTNIDWEMQCALAGVPKCWILKIELWASVPREFKSSL